MPCQCQTPAHAPCWFCSSLGTLLGIVLGVCIFSIWLNWESAPPDSPVMVKIVSFTEPVHWGSRAYTCLEKVDGNRFRKNGKWGQVGDVFCLENCAAKSIRPREGGRYPTKAFATFTKINGDLCSIVVDDLITSLDAITGHPDWPDFVIIVRDGLHFSVTGTYDEVVAKLKAASEEGNNGQTHIGG